MLFSHLRELFLSGVDADVGKAWDKLQLIVPDQILWDSRPGTKQGLCVGAEIWNYHRTYSWDK